MPAALESLFWGSSMASCKLISLSDTTSFLAMRKAVLGGAEVTVAGIAKGAGMIEPHMATMLAYVMTDAAVGGRELDEIFRAADPGNYYAMKISLTRPGPLLMEKPAGWPGSGG